MHISKRINRDSGPKFQISFESPLFDAKKDIIASGYFSRKYGNS